MQVSLFDFELPPERIAQEACEPRDAARLLHVADTLSDLTMRDLLGLVQAGDVLVFNNSKVIPARLFAEVGGKRVEVLLHRPVIARSDSDEAIQSMCQGSNALDCFADARNDCAIWHAFARPARKLKAGMVLTFGEGFHATVEGRTEDGQVVLRFDADGFMQNLLRYGHMPLPPYISRSDTESDAARYQTIYAQHEGSVAAPTAGLHFTPALMDALRAKGAQIEFVTLHVGAGTFQPVKVEDTAEHVMHAEWAEVDAATASRINEVKARGGRVMAVGTTSLRTLESATDESGLLQPFSAETRIFITPGYRFRLIDRLLTNFHLPKSTLFMLVSAFAGRERMQAAYAHAIAHEYRFYSYGDATLLERAAHTQ